jgi:glycosyltransferase involved in cell wall biosynthesis
MSPESKVTTGHRVVLVTTHYPPLVGGAATYFSLLAQTLSARGADVTVLTTRQPNLPAVEHGAVDVWRVIPSLSGAPEAIRQWAQAAATFIALVLLRLRGRGRIVHVHGSKSVTVGTAAFSMMSRVPVVYDVQDFFSRPMVIRRGANPQYTAAGNPIADRLASLGIARDRVLVLPSIPDDQARAPVAPRSGPGPCRCLFVGEVNHAVKGSDLLVRAFERVHTVEPTALLEVVGDGPDRATDEAFVRDHGLEAVVRFRGAIPAEQVLEAINSTDIVMMASRTEGMPRVILEAFARGVPVVAPRIGGIPEAVRDGETGLLVPSDDWPALADALLRLIGDPELRRSLGARGRTWVDGLPTWDGLGALVESVYDRAR